MDFEQISEKLKNDVAALAKTAVNDHVDQAIKDGDTLIAAMGTDMARWATQLAAGDMTEEDVAFLVEGRKELMTMQALERVGEAQIQIENFRNGLIKLITSAVAGKL